ncbi:MAG: hypothetical protein WDN69_11370 [Aliidongia sp.]
MVAHLQRIGTDVLFGFGSDQDFRDASQVIAEAVSGRARPARAQILPSTPARRPRRPAPPMSRICRACWPVRRQATTTRPPPR